MDSASAKCKNFFAGLGFLVRKSEMDGHTVRFFGEDGHMYVLAAYLSDGDEVQIWGK